MRFLNSFMMLSLVLAVVLAAIFSRHSDMKAQDNALPSTDSSQTEADGVPPGYRIIEGDILVPIANGTVSAAQVNTPSAVFSTNFWPNGIVPYEFDANVSAANQTAMLAAMADWEAATNVHFQPRNGESDYIHIQNSGSNSSMVGRQGGQQIINITNWGDKYIIAHELGHCLGFWHEQSRPDRDAYIQINMSNIQTGMADQFEKRSTADQYGPYDFDSLMHYDQCSFSVECPLGSTCSCTRTTITVLPPYDTDWQTKIGQRTHLSTMDQMTMSFLYPQPNWRFLGGGCTSGLCVASGSFIDQYSRFGEGVNNTPESGTLWIQPGTYSAIGTYNKPLIVQAPLGGVVLGQ